MVKNQINKVLFTASLFIFMVCMKNTSSFVAINPY